MPRQQAYSVDSLCPNFIYMLPYYAVARKQKREFKMLRSQKLSNDDLYKSAIAFRIRPQKDRHLQKADAGQVPLNEGGGMFIPFQ